MVIKKLFKRRKSIKKPNWFKGFIGFGVVFAILGVFVWNLSVLSFAELLCFTCDWEYITTYISDIAQYGCDGFTDEELDIISDRFAFLQVAFRIPSIITVDGEEVCNSSCAMAVLLECGDEQAGGKPMIIHWNPDTDEKVQKLLDYQNHIGFFDGYNLTVEDYYVDDDATTLYIGNVRVDRYKGITAILFSTFGSSLVVDGDEYDVVDLTPTDESLLEGLKHIDNTKYDGDDIAYFAITGSAKGGEVFDDPEYNFGSNPHYVYAEYNKSYLLDVRELLSVLYAWIIGICAFILTLIFATILYFKKKSTYNIFEYRRKTTNAMAHDLKTPLAIASLSVANLKEKLNVDNDRVEYHANEISDSIEYMDKLICNILDFSNSESVERKFTKENIDVRQELETYKNEISKVLSSKDLTMEISGEAKRTTDKKIWNQALYNLIDNAVKYSSKGSTIEITLDQKEIIISNSVDENVHNVDSLKEPFVKGDNIRGENSGSGLGLAIADNNLKALGYTLKLSCVNKKFSASLR